MNLITKTAMLASVKISVWTARKHDKRVSDQVASNNEASPHSGRYNKILIAKEAQVDITKIISKTRSMFYHNTLPWNDDGYRILAAKNYFDYMRDMGALKRKFDAAVKEFLTHYPDYQEQARESLGKLFDENDYPPIESLEKRFNFEIRILPVPSGDDFRVVMGEEDKKQIQADIEQRLKSAQIVAMNDIWERVHTAVHHMRNKLSSYYIDPDTKSPKNRFHETLVTNLRDLVDIMPKLNIADDPRLDELCKELKSSLCQHDAQVLREDTNLRKQTADEANRILDQLSGYVTFGGHNS